MKWLLLAAPMMIGSTTAALANCETDGEQYHVTGPLDDLYVIAEEYYDDRDKWTLILNANNRVLPSANPNQVPQGIRLRIPCVSEPVTQEVSAPPAREPAQDPTSTYRGAGSLRLLTGSDYAPFTDRDIEAGGLVTEIVEGALEQTSYSVDYAIFWEDAWSEHFELLRTGQYDMGFPWLKPNCDIDRENERCRNFHFSEPVFEMLVMLFTHKDAPIGFQSDADIEGHSICRPAGYYTHDLDRADRRWLENGTIELVSAGSVNECFEMLARKKVDAVGLNEFTGRTAIRDLGLTNCINVEPNPLSIEGLHAITYKFSPRATTNRFRFDEGVRKLRESAAYFEIVDRHMARHWAEVSDLEGIRDNCDNYAQQADDTDDTTAVSDDPDAGAVIEASTDLIRARYPATVYVFTYSQFVGHELEETPEGGLRAVAYRPYLFSGNGTGFLIKPDLVLTNAHVAGGTDLIVVANEDIGVVDVEVEDMTPLFQTGDLDLALLRLERELDVSPMTFSSYGQELDQVYSLGYPGTAQRNDIGARRFREAILDNEEPTAYPSLISSTGPVQSRRRNTNGVDVLIHDSEIAQGNSGGPLLDACGRVVGINTSLARSDPNQSATQYESAISTAEILDYLKPQGVEVEVETARCSR